MDWAKIKNDLTAEFTQAQEQQALLVKDAQELGQRLLVLKGKFEMAEEAEKEEQAAKLIDGEAKKLAEEAGVRDDGASSGI